MFSYEHIQMNQQIDRILRRNLNLTPIGKSRKQNPKIGCVTERHLWKQNQDKNPEYLVISLIFGCLTERHLRKQNPIQFYERINHSD